MKKPLIIIVDDDRAVLESLEAHLGPAFNEIARIEAFDDALDALKCAERWDHEGREVAVAIVDQRMPSIEGIELIRRMRASPAGARMKTALLTGYAGLETALSAKNDAGIDLYLEKPLDNDDLTDAASSLLQRWVRSTGAGETFEFREVRSREEILQLLRARYEVYAATKAVQALLPSDPAGLDVDAYDSVSRLFGLFRDHDGRLSLVGTLRVAGQEPAATMEAISAILADHPALLARYKKPREHALPLLEYLVDRGAVSRLYENLTRVGEQAVEPGRLTLQAAFRSTTQDRPALPSLARHIIDSATAFAFFLSGIEHALLSCVPVHARLYRHLGFQETEGTSTQYQPALGIVASCLHGTRHGVPSPAREVVATLARRAARTGSACRCVSFPQCLPDAYITGRFTSADVFCPIRARELLGS